MTIPKLKRLYLGGFYVLLLAAGLLTMEGCNSVYLRPDDEKSVDSSVVNQDETYRASVLNVGYRQALRSADIFVYVTPGPTSFTLEPNTRLLKSRIAFSIAGARPIQVHWLNATHLEIVCDGCGAPLQWGTQKTQINGLSISYSGFPPVPHELHGDQLDNADGTLRAEQFYYVVPGNSIADSTTVRVEQLPLIYDPKTGVVVRERQPTVLLELRHTKPLRLRWADNDTLVVTCDGCGRKLSESSAVVEGAYGARVLFKGFVGSS
jgi:hypothetical protein